MSEKVYSYKTVERPSEGLYKDRGSKFIAYATAIEDESGAQGYLEEVRRLHPKSRHCCYAWRLGVEEVQERANDDGEPSGSAGLPILNQLRSFELVNCMVVVVRYFGGSKLGMSGLITAYKEAAHDALKNAVIKDRECMKTIRLELPYEGLQHLYKSIGEWNGVILHQNIDNLSEFTVEIPLRHVDAFTGALSDYIL